MVFSTVFFGAIAFAIIQPIKVLPRERPAPGFSLTDQAGDAYTSETGRGSITLYTFQPLDCTGECARIPDTMAAVFSRVDSEVNLSEIEFKMVTIALADQPSTSSLQQAAVSTGADGQRWSWLGGSWDQVKSLVGSGFGRYFDRVEPGQNAIGSVESGDITFDPGFVLVDGNGVVRGEYRYQTLSNDADKLVSHVGLLADEARLSKGAASLAYEAAHLFACYG